MPFSIKKRRSDHYVFEEGNTPKKKKKLNFSSFFIFVGKENSTTLTTHKGTKSRIMILHPTTMKLDPKISHSSNYFRKSNFKSNIHNVELIKLTSLVFYFLKFLSCSHQDNGSMCPFLVHIKKNANFVPDVWNIIGECETSFSFSLKFFSRKREERRNRQWKDNDGIEN